MSRNSTALRFAGENPRSVVGTPGNDVIYGGDGDDVIGGDEGDDQIFGGSGHDTLYGNAGNDLLGGSEGNDGVYGGSGLDTLYGDAGNDIVNGEEGDDRVYGGAGQDTLYGGGGNDIVAGQDGDDYIEGGAGLDTLYGDAGNDVIIGQDGDDYIEGGVGRDLLYGNGGNDTVVGGADDDELHGLEGDDTVGGGDGDDRIYGGIGLDTLYGDAGNDIIGGSEGDDRIYGGIGLDTLYGDAGNDVIGGQESDDSIFGGIGQDSLYGDAGNDVIGGQDGDDLIEGGDGQDTLYGDAGNDVISGQDGDDYIEGGNGRDLIYGHAGNDTLIGGGDEDEVHGLEGDDTISGAHGDDRLYGGVGRDTLYGDDGNDVVGGSDDDDRLFGGLGQDTLYGDAGNDIASGQDGDDSIFGGSGQDTLYGDAGNDVIGGQEGDDVIEGGIGQDSLYGDAGNDVISGQDGDDYIDGGVGFDLIYGNAGNDAIYGGADNDELYGLEGDDTVGGSDGDDRVYGGIGQDTLYGDAGNDIVGGAEGDDRIFGGIGQDTLYGDAGNDIINGEDGDDSLFGALGQDILYGDAGNDSLSGQEDDDYIDAGAGRDSLYGDAGNDTLVGGAGADLMAGGAGDDSYLVDSADDRVEESANNGFDTVRTSTSYALGAGTSLETLATDNEFGTATINLTGNELANQIVGNAGDNMIDGAGGSDTLRGGGGSDTFAITAGLGGGNIATIVDFDPARDRLLLGGVTGQPFAALAAGAVSAGAFVVGSAALQADDRLIYNSESGALLYDVDGSGVTAAIQFATLTPGLALSAANFTVSGPANSAPIITSGTTAAIAENSPTGTIVYQGQASDPDGDAFTFSLSGTDASRFTIDGSGSVRLISPADFEVQNSYSFVVAASDSGVSTLRQVTVSVTDVAENVQSTPLIGETFGANDSVGQAQLINVSTLLVANNVNLFNDDLPSATIQGSISTNADRDFYSITLQQGELLVLDIDGTPAGLDTVIRVYNPAGQELGDNDDSPLDVGSAAHPGSATATLDSFLTFRAPTSGTYTFSVESYEQTSSGSYNLHVSVGPPASAAQIIREDVQALVSGTEWGTTGLTFGFPTSSSQYPAGTTQNDEHTNNFETFNPTQQNAVRSMLTQISQVTDLTFQELSFNPGQANLRYAMSDAADTAYAYLPTGSGVGGTSWYNNTDARWDSPVIGNYAWMGILHETGHALGLKHGHEFPAISPGRDSIEYTVMTYRAYPGADLEGYGAETWGFAQTLMMYDIAALQLLYGADFTFNGGNTSYIFDPFSGQMFVDGTSQGMPGANRIFRTIWDGGGDDTYDLSDYTNDVTIDLRPGEWTTTSQVQLANLGPRSGTPHYARGNVANALLFNDDPRSLIENAIGGSGFDTLIANQAVNRLTGGNGNDTFRWMSVDDSRPGAADIVADFISGSDRIDLSFIDANSNTPGDDTFRSIGASAFSGSAGELRHEVIGNSVHLFADVNGDAVADLHIILQNTTVLAPTDIFP